MTSCSCVYVWKDPNIYGDRLVAPLRASCRAIARIITNDFEFEGVGKLCELVSRIVLLALVLTFCVISLPFALIGMTIKFPCSLCTLPLPKSSTTNLYQASPLSGKGAEENNFFDLGEPFVTGIVHLCKTSAQMDYAIYVCTYVLSLVRHPHEEDLARKVLLKFPFDKLPTKANANINNTLVDVCICAVEAFMGKTFNTFPKEVFEELAVRLDTYFHGTSITAVDSIKASGLSRSKRCMNDQDEIEQIKATVGDIFGFYSSQEKQSFFVAEGASTAWLFAKRSPEWFASIFENIKQPKYNYRESPFYADKRNKVKAMQELEAGLKSRGKTEEQILKVKGFCEKFWKLYTGPYGAVVVARRNRPRHEAIDDWQQTSVAASTKAQEYLQRLYQHMPYKTVENSGGIEITGFDFAPQDLTIFRIPFHSMDAQGHVSILSNLDN